MDLLPVRGWWGGLARLRGNLDDVVVAMGEGRRDGMCVCASLPKATLFVKLSQEAAKRVSIMLVMCRGRAYRILASLHHTT